MSVSLPGEEVIQYVVYLETQVRVGEHELDSA